VPAWQQGIDVAPADCTRPVDRQYRRRHHDVDTAPDSRSAPTLRPSAVAAHQIEALAAHSLASSSNPGYATHDGDGLAFAVVPFRETRSMELRNELK